MRATLLRITGATIHTYQKLHGFMGFVKPKGRVGCLEGVVNRERFFSARAWCCSSEVLAMDPQLPMVYVHRVQVYTD